MVRLKELESTDEQAFTAFERRYKAECGSEKIPSGLNSRNLTFAEFWREVNAMGRQETCLQGFVPAKYFLIIDNERIVGAINLRYKDNDTILTCAGHIGYGIAPWERGKGYATEGLRLCLLKAWHMGMDKVLLTTDLDNYASQRVISKNGGVYERDIADKKLFWFDTNADVLREYSAMAAVFCGDNLLLATVENIYGNSVLSLPKGHIESGETPTQAAVRECREETGVTVSECEAISAATPFETRFMDHKGRKICKTITPVIFQIPDLRAVCPSEERIEKVSYMSIASFLRECTYDNVKSVVDQAVRLLQR